MIKYIKLVIFGFILSFIGFFNYSSALSSYTSSIGSTASNMDTTYSLSVSKHSYLNTINDGNSRDILMPKYGYYFFWLDSGLPYISSCQAQGYSCWQGVPIDFLSCNPFTNNSGLQNCQRLTYSSNSGLVSQLLSSVGYFRYGSFTMDNIGGAQGFYSCFSSSTYNKSICFYGCGHPNCGSTSESIGGASLSRNLTNSQNFGYTFTSIPVNNIGIYPGYTNLDFSFGEDGETQIINSNLDNIIKYYEHRFGFDRNMCYVGTNDLTSLYGSSVDFELGTGKTIFDLYYSIYNTFGNNSFNNVGSFINVNLLNYASWFEYFNVVGYSSGGSYYTPEERLYMAKYNGPDQSITMIYTGFTFPFADKPVAQFFMSDLLYTDYIKESSQGIEIALYCDLYLNYNSYKDGSKSLEDTLDKIDANILDRINLYVDRQLDGKKGYSIPDGSGSLWGGLVDSGYGIPEDLSPTKLFQDLYTKIDGLFSGFSPIQSVGIIPWWILYPMIFLILFRILRH